MEFVNFDYEKNREIGYKKLVEYFTERNPDYASFENESMEKKKLSYLFQENGITLGRMFGYIESDIFKIEGIFLEPEARGKGIGKDIIQQLEEYALQEGCRIVLLETPTSSAPQFYEKLGYSVFGEIPNYPLEGESCYYMMKWLRQ